MSRSPRAGGLNLFLLTATSCERFGPAEIVGIEDLDTGEVVAEADVTCWLWRELLDDEDRRHGGIRLEIAIDALPIRGLGPDCAKVLASHFRTFEAFLNCAKRAAEQWVTMIDSLDELSEKLLRYHYDTMQYGIYRGSFVPGVAMPGNEDLDAVLELMRPDEIGTERTRAIVEAVATGKVASAISTILAGRRILNWHGPTSRWLTTGPLSGHKIVFSGTLEGLTRAEAKTKAEQAGATVGGAVTIDTTLIVAGAEAGSKLKKAHRLGLRVISEAKFMSLLNGEQDGPNEGEGDE